jgi:hypothetical protein
VLCLETLDFALQFLIAIQKEELEVEFVPEEAYVAQVKREILHV